MNNIEKLLKIPARTLPCYLAITEHGILTPPELARLTDTSLATAYRSLKTLTDAGLVHETTYGHYALKKAASASRPLLPAFVPKVRLSSVTFQYQYDA